MIHQNRTDAITDASEDFSNALTFTYAHLAGLCHRKQALKLFGEDECHATALTRCCDVWESEVVDMTDKRAELAILVAAIDELGNRGEVKVTERWPIGLDEKTSTSHQTLYIMLKVLCKADSGGEISYAR